MALAAALPNDWPPLRIYFGITLILSVVGWTGLARVVRGKLLELREADFVMAARIAGVAAPHIITRHLLPSFMSYLIVKFTLSIPGMILAETALSFLGVGIQPPAISWGALLQGAQNVRTVALASPCSASTSSATACATPPTPTDSASDRAAESLSPMDRRFLGR